MTRYTHDWIEDLEGILAMEDDHCREGMRQYGDGPDHDLYSAHLANVAELQRRLRLYDAADELLDACRQSVNALNIAPRFRVGDTDSYAIASTLGRAISKAEGRIE